MSTDVTRRQLLPPFRERWAPVLGLLLLSPISAEYLIGYDSGIGRPDELLVGLVILAPLYGAPALLIREVTRRTGRGWPTIFLLATAFGVIQAGLIDQSLFHLEFAPDDPAWATAPPNSLIPGVGIDAANLMNFVGGHVIWSFVAPIAVMECCVPELADGPWLGRTGIVTMTSLYLLAAALIFSDVVDTMASPAQLIGTTAVAITLTWAAFAVPDQVSRFPGQVPPWWVMGAVALVLLGIYQLMPTTWGWVGVALTLGALLLLGGLLLTWSRKLGWGRLGVLWLAGAALLVRGGLSFLVEPLGEVDYSIKYAVNATILLGVVGLLSFASWRLRLRKPSSLSGAA